MAKRNSQTERCTFTFHAAYWLRLADACESESRKGKALDWMANALSCEPIRLLRDLAGYLRRQAGRSGYVSIALKVHGTCDVLAHVCCEHGLSYGVAFATAASGARVNKTTIEAPPSECVSRARTAAAEMGAGTFIPAIDPNIQPDDKSRAETQNAVILERLKQGPATNKELSRLSLKYTSRVSDLRKAGHAIKCRKRNGTNWYELVVQPSLF